MLFEYVPLVASNSKFPERAAYTAQDLGMTSQDRHNNYDYLEKRHPGSDRPAHPCSRDSEFRLRHYSVPPGCDCD